MTNSEQKNQFQEEFVRRFNEFARWAIDNRPDKNHPLDLSDFREFRMEMEKIVTGLDDSHHRKSAEPEQGGEQYVQITPTPWP
jgi:endo-1,4-beta-mannosidase